MKFDVKKILLDRKKIYGNIIMMSKIVKEENIQHR